MTWDDVPYPMRRRVAGALWREKKDLQERDNAQTRATGALMSMDPRPQNEIAAIDAALERLGFPQ